MKNYPKAFIYIVGFLASTFVVVGKGPSSHKAPNDTITKIPIHENVRTMPYPRAEHELYLNPPPMLVPKRTQKTDSLQFSYSQSADFSSVSTVVSKPVLWAMFSPHKILVPGVWYWRFRSVDKSGKFKPWSQSYSFTVKKETPEFATPPFERLLKGIPTSYPRLNCFLASGLTYARKHATEHPEYNDLIKRAESALKSNAPQAKNLESQVASVCNTVECLYQAHVITGDSKYSDKMISMVKYLFTIDIPEKGLGTDFMAGDYMASLFYVYDECQDMLAPELKSKIEQSLLAVITDMFRSKSGNDENHIFNNHFWQKTVRQMFCASLLLQDKYPIAKVILEYCYEIWVTRAPNSGFILDGSWVYGTGYFGIDAQAQYYMSGMLSYLTGRNFIEHPWYKNACKGLLYEWPANSMSPGFGDGHEAFQPSRIRIAFADYLAKETGDPYVCWYVNACNETGKNGNKLGNDVTMRLYRFANMNKTYTVTKLPNNRPKALWYKDNGLFVAHSNISDTQKSFFLSFRSSPFGSGSHTLADQNSFNLHYKGLPVYRSTGHYWNFCEPHNLLSYRHTRAHNTLLIDGIGQGFTTRAYGNIVRAFDGQNISYCLGDASNAYAGVSEYPMWIENFKNANITQTVENGFGKTPLKTYRRHVLMLHPDKVAIYDELEADKGVRWDWLLHSPVEFQTDSKQNKLTTVYSKEGFQSVAQLFCNQVGTFNQTDKYVADPDQKFNKHKVPVLPEWHMTASFGPIAKTRILTIIQVTPTGTTAANIVKLANGDLQCDDWVISSELDGAKAARLCITNNKKKNVVFSLGNDNPIINGVSYKRQFVGSSILYDQIEGATKIAESIDRPAQPTR